MITAIVPRKSEDSDPKPWPDVSCDDTVKFRPTKIMHDPVNHPSHYTYGKIECLDYIEDKGFNFNLGNAIKYITRAGHKGNMVEDLEKAVFYLNREISLLKGKEK